MISSRTGRFTPHRQCPYSKVPKKEEGSYFVLHSTVSIAGYSAAEFGKKESSQFLRGIRTFFVIGKADATVLHAKTRLNRPPKNPSSMSSFSSWSTTA